jgi:hypothetical protein
MKLIQKSSYNYLIFKDAPPQLDKEFCDQRIFRKRNKIGRINRAFAMRVIGIFCFRRVGVNDKSGGRAY